tara:strand:+ start:23955 stop:25292 length:1338 start_codon:yes stop_codon:yes gene_type:complete
MYIATLISVVGMLGAALLTSASASTKPTSTPASQPEQMDSATALAFEAVALLPGTEQGLVDIVEKVAGWIQYLNSRSGVDPRADGALAAIEVRDWATAAQQTASMDVFTNHHIQSDAFIGAAIVAYGNNEKQLAERLFEKAAIANDQSSDPAVFQLVGSIRLGYPHDEIKRQLDELVSDQSLTSRDRFIVDYAKSTLAARDGRVDQAASITKGAFKIVDREYDNAPNTATLRDCVVARAAWMNFKLDDRASRDWEEIESVAIYLADHINQLWTQHATTAYVYNTLSRYHRTGFGQNSWYDLRLADQYAESAAGACPRGDGKCTGDTRNSLARVLLERATRDAPNMDLDTLYEAEHHGQLAVESFKNVNSLQDEANARINLAATRAAIAGILWNSPSRRSEADEWNEMALSALRMSEDSFEKLDEDIQQKQVFFRESFSNWPPPSE